MVLAEGEKKIWQGGIKGTLYTITNLRLIIIKGEWVRDILLEAIYSIELAESLDLVLAGLLVALAPCFSTLQG